MKQLPEIPLHIPIDQHNPNWSVEEQWDLFDRFEDLPPLSIIDYLGCSFQRSVWQVVQQVKEEPLTAWNNAIFRAEALQVQYVDEGKISPVKVPPDQAVL
jgi:hypothetical protein